TALAGPASNLAIAAVMVVPLRLTNSELIGFSGLLASQIIFINLLLAAFNLIPIPPLDGSKILAGILPDFWYPYLARLEQYGFAILFLLILFGRFYGPSVLFEMYEPVLDLFWDVFVGPLELTGFRVR